jgi:hypothetical protein
MLDVAAALAATTRLIVAVMHLSPPGSSMAPFILTLVGIRQT